MLIRLFTSKCAFYVGDSTAKVVNSEQITTSCHNSIVLYMFYNLAITLFRGRSPVSRDLVSF